MRPASLVAAVVIVALIVGAAWAKGLLDAPQARVLCVDPVRGNLSADMDLPNVTQTPEGWVLHFPHRQDADRKVEVWQDCEVHQ
mgnify:CR=1 FL=1